MGALQVVEAFPYDTAPRYLLRDRDWLYASYFANRVRGMGIEEVLIAPHSLWQNPFIERLIGSIRIDRHTLLEDLVERGFPARPRPCRISQPGAVLRPGSARDATTAEIAPRLLLTQI